MTDEIERLDKRWKGWRAKCNELTFEHEKMWERCAKAESGIYEQNTKIEELLAEIERLKAGDPDYAAFCDHCKNLEPTIKAAEYRAKLEDTYQWLAENVLCETYMPEAYAVCKDEKGEGCAECWQNFFELKMGGIALKFPYRIIETFARTVNVYPTREQGNRLRKLQPGTGQRKHQDEHVGGRIAPILATYRKRRASSPHPGGAMLTSAKRHICGDGGVKRL